MAEITISIDILKNREVQVPPENEEDRPLDGYQLPTVNGPLDLPVLVYGGAVFSGHYNTDDYILSEEATRAVRLALRYGIRAFDTSSFYGPSEYVLGNILSALKTDFPRSSYQLMTKCGRFGMNDFDYSPSRIRESVLESLARLRTTYLDTVYLHDVEFVATALNPAVPGNHTTALDTEAAAYGVGEGDEGLILGEGDQKILDGFSELLKLKQEGIIKNIGISGYPLPVLLRLAILIHRTPPHEPVDMLLTYAHLTLQNSTLEAFVPHFYERAKVKQVLAASPLSMGLLTSTPPPWHPAPEALQSAVVEALKVSGDLPNIALGYASRQASMRIPLVVGFSKIGEVHECVKVWREVHEKGANERRAREEKEVMRVFERTGYWNWSWK